MGCLYLPNGNPQPGPKFDYKLEWFDRFNKHAAGLLRSKHPVVLAGDYNVVPTDADIYSPASWKKDGLLQPETRDEYQKLLKQGWTDAGLRIDHLLMSPAVAKKMKEAGLAGKERPGNRQRVRGRF